MFPFFFCGALHTLHGVKGMNGLFCAMLLAGTVYAAVTGKLDAAQRVLLSGGGEAVALLLELAGAYAFFGGMMGILRECGAADALARAMKRPLSRLFRFEQGEEVALSDISLNLSANMLGMGGAATPAGIAAMRKMARANGNDGHASDAMILFLVINTSSVQLLPTTMIALRAQAGAAQPTDIVLPVLAATAVSTACGVAICRGFAARGRRG